MKQYNFWKGVEKGFISLILFAIPFAINQFPDVANLTIGAVLTVVLNFLKVKYLSE